MYIDQDIKSVKGSTTLFMVLYLLTASGPCFSPSLVINDDQNFFALLNSLLDDMVDMGSYMNRIANEYPPYHVIIILSVLIYLYYII